ncbi:type II toxin-antitoxin system ParD family antitoxin [Vandammella animalimorsus]|uniref:Type II toxin-antitoxin system ParD family antitoxin n=1 Tax=Vandammella animalimorsus TaxID=2029117 RepID=A0A2A2A9S6_9BURK|nr:type II toxin-antitoxin system ParD family antitoxin [Vandammella animalimorsus]PAT34522.1 type II toxin-antitoxin system ParD family antitoxin [Vandammella animalimorsus]PAT39655.1 type II toxin-antitoxin system ParD family antitoxin [Vandammella animalimorsus]
MSKGTFISLDEHCTGFIQQQIMHGRYGSTSDVVRAGLHLLEKQQQQWQALSRALEEGERSGVAQGFDLEEFLQTQRQNHAG